MNTHHSIQQSLDQSRLQKTIAMTFVLAVVLSFRHHESVVSSRSEINFVSKMEKQQQHRNKLIWRTWALHVECPATAGGKPWRQTRARLSLILSVGCGMLRHNSTQLARVGNNLAALVWKFPPRKSSMSTSILYCTQSGPKYDQHRYIACRIREPRWNVHQIHQCGEIANGMCTSRHL